MGIEQLKLREYQDKAVKDIRVVFAKKIKTVLLVSPVASGKTVMFSWLAWAVYNKGKRVLLLGHRDEILDQISEKLSMFSVPHGFVRGGDKSGINERVIVGSVASVARCLDKIARPDLIIVDEAKHCIKKTQFGKCVNYFPDAFVLGVDASPERHSKEGMGEIFKEIVYGPTVRWLIDNGYLSDYEMYAPLDLPDLADIKIDRGEYIQAQVEQTMNKPSITGKAVEQYKELADGKCCLVFCTSVKHAQDVAAEFCVAGYKFVSVDGQTPKPIRKQAVENLRIGVIDGITNCMLFCEGTDLPRVECVIDLSPTMSLALDIQKKGRGLRVFPGKEKLIIIDSAGNCYRHGLPCTPREWSLDGKKRRARGAVHPLRHCKECRAIYDPALSQCPRCGSVQLIEHREIKQRKGRLAKITPEEAALIMQAKKKKRMEMGKCRTKEELMALAKKRGYANPWAYAQFVLKGRQKNGSSR